MVVILNAMVSTSDSTTAAQPNRYSALPNTEGVQGQRGVGKGVAPSQFLVSIHLLRCRWPAACRPSLRDWLQVIGEYSDVQKHTDSETVRKLSGMTLESSRCEKCTLNL